MKIEAYLDEHKVPYEKRQHSPAFTAQEVAAEEHVPGRELAKAVIVHTGTKYVMCVLPASYRLDMKKLAGVLGVNSVRLADEQEMAELFPDAEVGAEPPFGNLYNLRTIVDQQLAEDEQIVFQSGSHRTAIRMPYATYADLVKPEVRDLAVYM